jgi:hypothetical protein
VGSPISAGKEEMSFYVKVRGKYIPVEAKKIFINEWENSLIALKVGEKGDSISDDEIIELTDEIDNAQTLGHLRNTSFVISAHNLNFEIVGSSEIGNKYVSISINSGDDLKKLGELQKNAKEQLKEMGLKSIIMPAPLTINEYKEVMEVKQRCDMRRQRRKNC